MKVFFYFNKLGYGYLRDIAKAGEVVTVSAKEARMIKNNTLTVSFGDQRKPINTVYNFGLINLTKSFLEQLNE